MWEDVSFICVLIAEDMGALFKIAGLYNKRNPPCIGDMELLSLSCNRVFISAEADVKSRLQRSDTSSIPPINVVFFLCRELPTNYTFVWYTKLVNKIGTAVAKVITF